MPNTETCKAAKVNKKVGNAICRKCKITPTKKVSTSLNHLLFPLFPSSLNHSKIIIKRALFCEKKEPYLRR